MYLTYYFIDEFDIYPDVSQYVTLPFCTWGGTCGLLTRWRDGPSRVQMSAGAKAFSLLQNVHPPSCTIGTGEYLLVIMQPGCKTDHAGLSSAEVKNEWNHISVTLVCLCGGHRQPCCTFAFVLLAKKKNLSCTLCVQTLVIYVPRIGLLCSALWRCVVSSAGRYRSSLWTFCVHFNSLTVFTRLHRKSVSVAGFCW